MNKDIDKLTIDIWKDVTNVFEELEKIKMSLINIKISVARIDSTERGALSTVADYLENSIKDIQLNTFKIKENTKAIARFNKEKI